MDLVMTLVPSRSPAGFLDGVTASRQHHGASERRPVTRFLKGQLTLSERTEGFVPAAHNGLHTIREHKGTAHSGCSRFKERKNHEMDLVIKVFEYFLYTVWCAQRYASCVVSEVRTGVRTEVFGLELRQTSGAQAAVPRQQYPGSRDRKSTRLNSSHL